MFNIKSIFFYHKNDKDYCFYILFAMKTEYYK